MTPSAGTCSRYAVALLGGLVAGLVAPACAAAEESGKVASLRACIGEKTSYDDARALARWATMLAFEHDPAYRDLVQLDKFPQLRSDASSVVERVLTACAAELRAAAPDLTDGLRRPIEWALYERRRFRDMPLGAQRGANALHDIVAGFAPETRATLASAVSRAATDLVGGVPPPKAVIGLGQAVEQPTDCEYPLQSRKLGQVGHLYLIVFVQPDGRPGEVTLDASSGTPLLDLRAVECAQRMRFRPHEVDGRPVGAYFRLRWAWSLSR